MESLCGSLFYTFFSFLYSSQQFYMQRATLTKASLTVSQDTMAVAQNLNGGGAVY